LFLSFWLSSNIYQSYHPIPWPDSISRPIAPISLVAGGDVTTRLCRQANMWLPWEMFLYKGVKKKLCAYNVHAGHENPFKTLPSVGVV
jgi:hypothetical protein